MAKELVGQEGIGERKFGPDVHCPGPDRKGFILPELNLVRSNVNTLFGHLMEHGRVGPQKTPQNECIIRLSMLYSLLV